MNRTDSYPTLLKIINESNTNDRVKGWQEATHINTCTHTRHIGLFIPIRNFLTPLHQVLENSIGKIYIKLKLQQPRQDVSELVCMYISIHIHTYTHIYPYIYCYKEILFNTEIIFCLKPPRIFAIANEQKRDKREAKPNMLD